MPCLRKRSGTWGDGEAQHPVHLCGAFAVRLLDASFAAQDLSFVVRHMDNLAMGRAAQANDQRPARKVGVLRVNEQNAPVFDGAALDGVVAHGVGQVQKLRHLGQRNFYVFATVLGRHAQQREGTNGQTRIDDTLDHVVCSERPPSNA